MFTYEWLGMPSESGIRPVFYRSVTWSRSPTAAIAHAKNLLKGPVTFPTGKPHAVRVLDKDSILIWTGTAHDA
jgi:hypothetical protein